MVDISTCLAFDLDDTLFKEINYVLSGQNAVAAHFGKLLNVSADCLCEIMRNAPDAFDALLSSYYFKKNNWTISDILSIYRSHNPSLTLPKDTFDTLTRLKEKGVELAIITDGRSITQRNKINALGLDKIVKPELILISEEIGADKLTPEPFKCLEARCKAKRLYMVGDNPTKDFYHPNLMGWTSVMLLDKDGVNVPSQSLDNIGREKWPKIFIENITQLIELCLPH